VLETGRLFERHCNFDSVDIPHNRGCTVRLDHLHHKRKGEDNIIPNTFYSAKMLWEIETRNGMET
jgi:hypothetical protein